MEEQFGEDLPPLGGEGGPTPQRFIQSFKVEEQIKEKKLSFDEASRCLNTLGKDESGVRYAYLMITATDRKLTDVTIILNFKHVLFLDLSGNFLSLDALQAISGMPFLLYLKVERNMVESAALDPIYYLQCLILNKNRITETCDINQPFLETLELQDNLIFTIQFDDERLKTLKLLNLRGNQLMDLSGTYPKSLEKLFLNQNKISKIAVDFSQLRNLKVLHLRDNQIRKLTGFTDQLENLTYLNLRNNKIVKLREFRKLQCLPKLDTLIVLDNPVSGLKDVRIPGEGDDEEEEDEIFGEDQSMVADPTRVALIVLLPNLQRINKDVVTFEEREEAEIRRTKILEEIFEELSSEEETELPTTTDFTTDYTTETDADADLYNTKVDDDDAAVERDSPVADYNTVEENLTEPSNIDSLPSEVPADTEAAPAELPDTTLAPSDENPLEGIKEENEAELERNQ